MAKIIDPDSLTITVNATATTEQLEIQTGAKTIKLLANTPLSDANPGSDSGVTGKCFYSKLKEVWESNATLNKYRFPIQMIYEAQFIWINGWGPADDQTRDLIRDAGFLETDGRENACIISLGSMFDDTQQAYYSQAAGFNQTTLTFDKTGTLNENVTIKGTGGTPDNTSYFKAFLRVQGKTHSSYNLLSEQGLSALTYQAYRLPLGNAADINITHSDTQIGTTDTGLESGVTFSELTIDYLNGNGFTTAADTSYSVDDVVQDSLGRWYRCTTAGTLTGTGSGQSSWGGTSVWESYPGERQIGTNYYAFNRIIDANDVSLTSARLKELYSWTQYKLRQSTDINDNVNGDGFGTVKGELANEFLYFVGSTLHTIGGVYIDNFDANDKNDIRPHDITVDSGGLNLEGIPLISTERQFPFTAAGSFTFNAAINDEVDSTTQYTAYFAYHSRTTGSYTLTLDTGADGNLTWSGTDLDHIQTGDYLILSGFVTNPELDGEYVVNSTGANTMNITNLAGTTIITETATITVDENPFESLGATIVDDNSGTDMDGDVTSLSINWDYDYTTNTQRGAGTGGTDAPIIVVAIAHDGAQYISVPYTITQSTGQNINIFPSDELNYANP